MIDWTQTPIVYVAGELPVALTDHIQSQAPGFFGGRALETVPPAHWINFAAKSVYAYLPIIESPPDPELWISKSAVEVMCQTMADTKTEELAAARSDTRQNLIASLSALADECHTNGDPDELGVRRAIIVLERSV